MPKLEELFSDKAAGQSDDFKKITAADIPALVIVMGCLSVTNPDDHKDRSVRPRMIETTAYLCGKCDSIHLVMSSGANEISLFADMDQETAEVLADQLRRPRILPKSGK